MRKKNMMIFILFLLLAAYITAVIGCPHETAIFTIIATMVFSTIFLVGSIIYCCYKPCKSNIHLNKKVEVDGFEYYVMSAEYKTAMDNLLDCNQKLIDCNQKLKSQLDTIYSCNTEFKNMVINMSERQEKQIEEQQAREKAYLRQIEELKTLNAELSELLREKEQQDTILPPVLVYENEIPVNNDSKEIIISENDSMDGWIEYELLGSNLYQTGLSLKTVEILQNVGIVKVGELICHTKMQIASINGIGEQKLKKIGDFMANTKLNYGTEVRERNGKWYVKAVTE